MLLGCQERRFGNWLVACECVGVIGVDVIKSRHYFVEATRCGFCTEVAIVYVGRFVHGCSNFKVFELEASQCVCDGVE